MDADSLIDELINMGVVHSGVDRSRLRRDVERLLGKYTGAMLKDINIQEILEEITALVPAIVCPYPRTSGCWENPW